jgi:hypothetical protein
MNKQLVLTFLCLLLFAKASAQIVYYSEQNTNRIRTATLTSTAITSPADFLLGTYANSLDYDQVNDVLYYLTDGGATLVQANPIDGSTNSIVITEGAMAELVDISFSDNAGQMIFAANSPEVDGLQQIPSNNNDSGLDSRLSIGMFNNSDINSVVVDDGAEIIYLAASEGTIAVVDFSGNLINTIPGFAQPLELAHDIVNNDLYVVNYNGSNYEVTSYDLDGINGYTNYYSTTSPITDIQVYPSFNKVYFAVENSGIYSAIFDIGTITNEIPLAGAGAITFDFGVDQTAPVFITLSPADGSTNLTTTNPVLTMTFSENIQRSTTTATGNESTIRLMQLSNGNQTSIIDRTSTGNISIVNNVATITFPATLAANTDYYILIGNKVFSDASGNNFIGISLNTGWNVKTVTGVTLNLPTAVACVGTYKNYPTITITESNAGNFHAGASQTLTFAFSSAGYTFENTIGTIAVSGGDITLNSWGISNTLLSLNYTISGTSSIDAITISGLKMRSTADTNPSTTVARSGGTAVIDGLITGNAIANVNTQAQPPPPTVTLNEGSSICLDSDPSAYTVTSSGTSIRWFTENNLFTSSFITALNDIPTVSAQDLGITATTAGPISRYVRQNVGGCISLAAPIDFTVNDNPQNILTASTEQTSCAPPNGSASVTSVDGGATTNYSFAWFDQAINPLGVTTSSITGVAAGTYHVEVTSLTTGCLATASVVITADIVLPAITFAATPNSHCSTPNGALDATITNQVGPLSDYSFTWYNGPSTASPVNPSSTTATLSNLVAGTYTVSVLHVPTQCSGVATSTVVDNITLPVPVPPNGDICESTPGSGTANVNLTTYNSAITAGNTDLSVTWRDASDNVVTSVVVANNDAFTYQVLSASTGCLSEGTLTFTVHAAPTAANAGPDMTICGATTIMDGNLPTVGSGTWSILSGTGGSIVTPGNRNSVFNGVTGTAYVLQWTISNGAVCPVSADQAGITFNALPVTANAGTDQSLCNTTTTLGANSPGTGSGTWSVINGAGGTFTNNASPTSGFTGTAGVAYTLRWTINDPCGSTSDDVVITLGAPPTASNAGTDQTVCGTSVTLASNNPASGTGLWTIVSGAGGSFSNPALPNSSFNGVVGATYTLRWTISNTPCTASTDDVLITFNAAPTTANAGTDKNFCGATVAMTANTPAAGTGTWSVVSGTGGSFSNVSAPSTSFTGTTGQTYTLRWTISNGTCASSSDDVTVVLIAPPTPANAGSDQVICNVSSTLAANTPSSGTGSWSVVTGAGGTFSNNASPSSTFTGNTGVTYTLRWTITNGICSPSTDDITISLSSPLSTPAAGSDQSLCGTSVALSANTPSSGSGTWSIVSGSGGTVTTPSSPNSNFTGAVGNTYVLRWTISKAGCTPLTDDVSITFKGTPTGNGIITPDADLCVGTGSTLAVTGYSNATSFQWTVPAGIAAVPGTGPSLEITAQSGNGGNVTVTPQNDCGAGTPASVSFGVLPQPSVEIILPPLAYAEQVVVFSFNSDQAIQDSQWSFGDGASASDPAPQHAYGAAGNFEILLTVTGQNGCVNTATETYTVSGEPELNDRAIKNVITANGDDKNRILYIENLDRYPDNEVRFLDRWGVELYSKTNYQNDWEAKGKDGQFLPAGQYVCIVKLNSNGKVISRTVSIIKGR